MLEYLYKGDYFPRLVHSKGRNSWDIERTNDVRGSKTESTVYHSATEGTLLKDTVIYCAAEKYGLEELKRVALRKQGLRELRIPSYCIYILLTGDQQSPVFSAAPFSPPPATHIPTHPTPTPSCALTTSLSLSAVGPPSSVAAPCSLRCSTAAVNFSSTYLSLFATTSTMFPTHKPRLAATGTSEKCPLPFSPP